MPSTIVSRPRRRTIRSAFQAFVAFAGIAPLIYTAATNDAPEAATGLVAVGIGVCAAVTRVMALPAVEGFLQRYVPILAANPPAEE
jgi:hypothetical protein